MENKNLDEDLYASLFVREDQKVRNERLDKELEEVRNKSKQKCDEMGIDISLIALEKLGNMGFKKELLGTNILAGLVEDLWNGLLKDKNENPTIKGFDEYGD